MTIPEHYIDLEIAFGTPSGELMCNFLITTYGREGVDLLESKGLALSMLLILCARKNLIDLMQYLGDIKGVDVNEISHLRQGYKSSPIIEAVNDNAVSSTKWLLDNGADPNARSVGDNGHSYPVLWNAAAKGISRLCHMLLEAGADPNGSKTDTGFSCLHIAAQNQCLQVVQLLIQRGATLRPSHNKPETPLGIAVAIGHVEIVAALVAQEGALPDLFAETLLAQLETGGIPDANAEESQQMGQLLRDHGRVRGNTFYQMARQYENRGDYRSALHALSKAHNEFTKVPLQLTLDTKRMMESVYGVKGSDGRVSYWKRHTWFSDDPQPPGQTWCVSVVHKNFVYQHSGRRLKKNEMYPVVESFWRMNLTTKAWKEVKTTGNSPGPRSGHSGIVYKDAIYIYGGETRTKNAVSTMHRLDLKTMAWTQLKTKGLKPASRCSASMTLYKDKFYLFGGEVYGGIANDLWSFSPATLKWKELRPAPGVMPTPRHVHGGWAYQNKLYFFGGQTFVPGSTDMISGQETVSTMQRMDLDTKVWEDVKCVGDPVWEIGEFTVLPLYRGQAEASTVLVFGGYVERGVAVGSFTPEDMAIIQEEPDYQLNYRRRLYRFDMDTQCWTHLALLRDYHVMTAAQSWAHEVGSNEGTTTVMIGGGYGTSPKSFAGKNEPEYNEDAQLAVDYAKEKGMDITQGLHPEVSREVYMVDIWDERSGCFLNDSIEGKGWAWEMYDQPGEALPQLSMELHVGGANLHNILDACEDDWRTPPSSDIQGDDWDMLGRLVTLTDLKGRKELNGSIGRCGAWSADTERYAIHLPSWDDNGPLTLAVKPANLIYAPPLTNEKVQNIVEENSSRKVPTPEVSGVWMRPVGSTNSAFVYLEDDAACREGMTMCTDTYRGPFSSRVLALLRSQRQLSSKGLTFSRVSKDILLNDATKGTELKERRRYDRYLKDIREKDSAKVDAWMKKTLSRKDESLWPEMLQVHVYIDAVTPRIERTLLVSSTISLQSFHIQVLCPAFGWEPNIHAYAFRALADIAEEAEVLKNLHDACWIGPRKSTALDIVFQPFFIGGDMADDTMIQLGDLFDVAAGASTVRYVQDFGDWWSHTIHLSTPSEERKSAPGVAHLISGQGSSPPGDIGGPVNYARKMLKLSGKSPITASDLFEKENTKKPPKTKPEDPSKERWWEFLNNEIRAKERMGYSRMACTHEFDLEGHQQELSIQLRRRLQRQGTEMHNAVQQRADLSSRLGELEESPQQFKKVIKRDLKCAVCDVTAGLKICAGCKAVAFCSREHQVEYWPKHKAECKKIKKQNANRN